MLSPFLLIYMIFIVYKTPVGYLTLHFGIICLSKPIGLVAYVIDTSVSLWLSNTAIENPPMYWYALQVSIGTSNRNQLYSTINGGFFSKPSLSTRGWVFILFQSCIDDFLIKPSSTSIELGDFPSWLRFLLLWAVDAREAAVTETAVESWASISQKKHIF